MLQIDEELLKRIDKLELSERAARLRKEFFATKPKIAGEEVLLKMQSWKETEGEALPLRRAKELKKVLENVPIVIFQGQRLVGSQTKYLRGACPRANFDGQYLSSLLGEKEGTMALGGVVERAIVEPEDWAIIKEAAKFWKGKTYVEKAKAASRSVMGSWGEDIAEAGSPPYEQQGQAPPGDCWRYCIANGASSYIKEIEEHIRRFEQDRRDDVDRFYFWQATIIALQSLIAFANRYAQRASLVSHKLLYNEPACPR
ncbi:MAG: pyruvate formate lyase family protein, partial [Chloroflexota bacterium]